MNAHGDYRIVRVLGQGGMGVVYEAEHGSLGRRVALKVLVEDGNDDPIALARLRREALAMGALQHPHIVQVSDFSEGPPPFLVMELLEGQSLKARLVERGPMRPEDACVIAVQLLSALAAAHRAGIAHRDVKPANIFMVETPLTELYVKLLDFGVAKLLTPQAGPALTSVDAIIGSAPYMAPEQIRGEAIDAKTDLFAVGVTLYELLAGRRPFVAAPNESVMLAILRGGPIAPLAAPRALEQIVLRALQREPTARYLTADDMAAALMPFVAQASLGAVTTFATTRRESRPEMGAPPETAPALDFATHRETHTRDAPRAVGPPTHGPPTLHDARDPTASASPGVPPMTEPMPNGSMVAPAPLTGLPKRSPKTRKWAWVLLGAVWLLTVALVALRVGRSVVPGESGPGVTTTGRGALAGSCTVRKGRSPELCEETYGLNPIVNPLDSEAACVLVFKGTWSPRPCSRVGAVAGCRHGYRDSWYYEGALMRACVAPREPLTP